MQKMEALVETMDERFENFTLLIAGIGRSILRIKKGEMARYGLAAPHTNCLYYLYKSGEMSAGELCAASGEDKAAISRSIGRLEAEGYIKRIMHGRRPMLALTEKGCVLGAEISEKIENVLSVAGATIGDSDRAALYEMLGIIDEDLRRIAATYEEEEK
jgi:DNA-binding MarR family transcriptional regulator